MHLGKEPFSLAIQFPKQPGQVAVAPIKANERKVQAFPPQAHHHLQGDLALGTELLCLLGYPDHLATDLIVGPSLRQIQLGIHHACHAIPSDCGKTPTWQLSTFPRRPFHCRATPADISPFFSNALSSSSSALG